MKTNECGRSTKGLFSLVFFASVVSERTPSLLPIDLKDRDKGVGSVPHVIRSRRRQDDAIFESRGVCEAWRLSNPAYDFKYWAFSIVIELPVELPGQIAPRRQAPLDRAEVCGAPWATQTRSHQHGRLSGETTYDGRRPAPFAARSSDHSEFRQPQPVCRK